MCASFNPAIARPALLEIARTSGGVHLAGCVALLELIGASDRLQVELRRELSQARLSHTGFNILALIYSDSSNSVGSSGIAGQLALSSGTVSAAVARLEMAGLVALTREPDNRRHINLSLTAAGTATIRTALERIEAGIARLMQVLSVADLRQLRDACARLAPASSTTHS